jgi:hypothetical protein
VTAGTSWSTATVDFSSISALNNSSSVYLEDLFTITPPQGVGTLSFDNITISAQPVPEPTTGVLTLLGLAIAGGAFARVRQGRRPQA